MISQRIDQCFYLNAIVPDILPMKKKYLILAFSFLACIQLFAQDEVSTEPAEPAPPKPFAIPDLRAAGEETQKTLDKVTALATDTAAIYDLDTALVQLKTANPFRVNEDSLAVDYQDMTLWLLKTEAEYWREYLSNISGVLDRINDRYDDLSEYLAEIGKLETRWKLTEKMADTVDLPDQVEESIGNYAQRTAQVRTLIIGHLDMLAGVKKHAEKEVQQINLVKAQIDEMTNEQAKSIFSQDAKPLFQALREDRSSFISVFKSGVKSDLTELRDFLKVNANNLVYHISVTLLIILILFAMRVHFFKHGK